jgi:predicted PurR-regulated permease PerM
MHESSKRSKGTQFLITVAAFVIVVAGMRAAEKILVPFLLSAFLAIICATPLFWLRRKRVPTALALLIVIAGIAAMIEPILGTKLRKKASRPQSKG